MLFRVYNWVMYTILSLVYDFKINCEIVKA